MQKKFKQADKCYSVYITFCTLVHHIQYCTSQLMWRIDSNHQCYLLEEIVFFVFCSTVSGWLTYSNLHWIIKIYFFFFLIDKKLRQQQQQQKSADKVHCMPKADWKIHLFNPLIMSTHSCEWITWTQALSNCILFIPYFSSKIIRKYNEKYPIGT